MKKLKGSIALIILILSWIGLYWLTGSRTPWLQFTSDENGGVAVYLGDIPTDNYDRMGFTKATICYAPTENGWLVGTSRGELLLFDNTGHQLWKRSLGIGKLISACLSKDGSLAYIGEQSPEGHLYAVNVRTGDIVWKYKGSDFVGADASQRSYPSVVHIAVDKDDNAFANVYRFLMDKNGNRSYRGRMLAVNSAGDLLWKYPADEAIDSWINWCDVNDNNDRVVISTSAYDFREDMHYKDTMYFLDKHSGKQLGSAYVPPVPPFDNSVMRGSPNFSEDGKYLAGSCSDGRGFLFDAQGKVLWERTLSQPAQVAGAWINASGRDGFATKYGVVFTTINTFNRENWQLPTPVEHPSNNSMFVFDYDGKFKYQYRAEGTMEQLAFADNLVACAVGRNVRTHAYSSHGALIIDLSTGKNVDFFHTEGPLQAIAISPNGRHVGGVEAPAVTPDGKIIGAHKLHIWNRTKEN